MNHTSILNQLSENQLAFLHLLQKELDQSLEQTIMDAYDYCKYGSSHATKLNFVSNAIGFVTNPEVLANEFVQQELHTYCTCVNEFFALELLVLVAKVNAAKPSDKEYELSKIVRDYDYPTDFLDFTIGMIGSFGLLIEDLLIEDLEN